MYICVCNAISERQLQDAIAQGAADLGDLRDRQEGRHRQDREQRQEAGVDRAAVTSVVGLGEDAPPVDAGDDTAEPGNRVVLIYGR